MNSKILELKEKLARYEAEISQQIYAIQIVCDHEFKSVSLRKTPHGDYVVEECKHCGLIFENAIKGNENEGPTGFCQ